MELPIEITSKYKTYVSERVALINADCLEVLPQLVGVDAVVTDPPYSSGGQFRGDRNGATSAKYQNTETVKEYPEFHGDTRDQRSFYFWCAIWLGLSMRSANIGAPVLVFTDWRQLAATVDAVQVAGLVYRGIVPWNKTEAARPTRGRFRSQCEYIVWGSYGPMNEQVEECLPGFFTYTVKPDEKEHVTGKPVGLMADILKIAKNNALVLDPFMGSGTTGVAAMQTGRRFVGIEIDPTYYAIAEKRIKAAEAQLLLGI